MWRALYAQLVAISSDIIIYTLSFATLRYVTQLCVLMVVVAQTSRRHNAC